MILKLSVIACLLAVAVAQTPARPVFPETFYASGEVELHVAEETRFGKCECKNFNMCRASTVLTWIGFAVNMARDPLKLMGVESNNFDGGEVEEMLQRYDQKNTYYIRSETH